MIEGTGRYGKLSGYLNKEFFKICDGFPDILVTLPESRLMPRLPMHTHSISRRSVKGISCEAMILEYFHARASKDFRINPGDVMC